MQYVLTFYPLGKFLNDSVATLTGVHTMNTDVLKNQFMGR